jgi:hypothetical protein
MRLSTILGFALGLLSCLSVHAHAPSKGKHGGRLVDAGSYHVELVVKDRDLSLYVYDHDDKPLPVTGYSGTFIFVLDGKPQRIPLQPGNDNRLTGTLPSQVSPTVKGAVQLRRATGDIVQGKFD